MEKKRGLSPIYLDSRSLLKRPEVIKRPRKRQIVFGWYGGKFSHLKWLLPLLPKCRQYCEPFAGSAAVLLNREPAMVETCNDLDGDLVNFFQVLRDQSEDLIYALSLTPFSREEYYLAIHSTSFGKVERARCFYIKARQSRIGLAQSPSLGRWPYCVKASTGGMSSAGGRWLNGIKALEGISQRLLCVQIENRPAIDVIKIHDDPSVLFYCDPPYLLGGRRKYGPAYFAEMDEEDYCKFAEVANACCGKMAISGYDHPLMDELFPVKKWFKTFSKEKPTNRRKSTRQEVLWTNYNPSITEGGKL